MYKIYHGETFCYFFATSLAIHLTLFVYEILFCVSPLDVTT